MRKKFTAALAVISLIALSSIELQAQRGSGRGRYQADRIYNSAAVETVQGSVIDVATARVRGLHITVKTSRETINIHLGPESYLKGKISLSRGDSITAVGSRFRYDGKDVIIAKSIQKGQIIVELRDENGTPKWTGQGKRRR
jgi:hypothetical protein